MAVTPVRFVTATGVLLAVVAPLPSSPSSPWPHALTVPPDRSATLNRPPANFVDTEYLDEITCAVEAAADARAIVLASDGKHFCAGAALGGGGSPGSRSADGRHIYDVAIRLFEQTVPMVAAVQGSAVGAGLGLALAADFRVATRETRFLANFALLGFHHGFGMTEASAAPRGKSR